MKNKGGRPHKEIDKNIFETMCSLQCTVLEFESELGCCYDTLDDWCKRTYTDEFGVPMGFSNVFDKKKQRGKISLRRAGFQLAQSNPAVWIFHAKNFLGMKDIQEVEYSKKTSETIDAVEAYINDNGNDETNETAD